MPLRSTNRTATTVLSRLSNPIFLGMIGALLTAALVLSATRLNAEENEASSALARYLNQKDASYAWDTLNERKVGGASIAEIKLTSQTWRGITWKHLLYVITPSTVKEDEQHAMLFITGGGWREELENGIPDQTLPGETRLFVNLAEKLQTPVAVLLQVPFQPIFDGKVEDQIIALTFSKYLETGEADWPLLLPMVKAAVRGMDTTQSYLQDTLDLNIETFTVSGASKRGWTTWLTGAHDSRVTAIAPMVIDVLNMAPQMKHQLGVWGDYSSEINDYSERGLQELLSTPAGGDLRRIVDPFEYRQQLTQSKLIMIGTNDKYWPVDALNLYWDDLQGDKRILYVPNAGHDLNDLGRVLGGLHGLHTEARGGKPLPKLNWSYATTDKGLKINLDFSENADNVRLWQARSDRRDFREATWSSRPLKTQQQQCSVLVEFPQEGYSACFLEADFPRGDLPLFLSTNMQVLNSQGTLTPQINKPAEE